MKITILLHRQTQSESQPGFVWAYQIMNGLPCRPNLAMPGVTKDLEEAQRRAEAYLKKLLDRGLLSGSLEFNFRVDESGKPLKVR